MKFNQKGFSPIFIIVIAVMVAAIVGIIIFTNSSKNSGTLSPSNNNQKAFTTVAPDISSSSSLTEGGVGFEKVEDSAYVFYYPKSYIKGQLGEKEVLNYQNPNTKAVEPESIYLKIEPSSRKFPNPTYQSCLKVAESMRQKAEDKIKAEVVRGGFGDGKGVGCKLIMNMSVTGVNDSVMIIQKTLWNDTGANNSIYSVRALYYSDASKDEAQQLGLAVDQFSLK